jgi:hypothetical protein
MRVDEAWRVHRQWSIVATRAGDQLNRWRRINLSLLVAGSVLGALAAQDNWLARSVTVAVGAASAGVLAIAGLVQARLLTADKVRARAGTRAASEAIKGLVYQYLAAVAPFAGPERDSELGLKVTEAQQMAMGFAALVVGTAPDDTAPPQVGGVVDYVRMRAQDQRNWHASRTMEHKRLALRWRVAELLATAAAAILAAVGGTVHGPDLSAWVAVATTVGTAFAAHRASQQHDRIADSYARTVLDLDAALQSFAPDVSTDTQAAEFVMTVERILAAQNDAWVSLFTVR